MSQYVAAYDVSDDQRRRAVAAVLSSYGQRIQQSVFEIWLEPPELPELRRSIGPLLAVTDAFDLVPIDNRGTRPRYRWQRPVETQKAVLLC